jgi:flotillin
VIEQQTALAERQASLAAQRLEAEVRRPADAEADRKRTLAEADRDQARFEAEADAYRKTTLAAAEREQARQSAEASLLGGRELAHGAVPRVQTAGSTRNVGVPW